MVLPGSTLVLPDTASPAKFFLGSVMSCQLFFRIGTPTFTVKDPSTIAYDGLQQAIQLIVKLELEGPE